MRWIPFGGPEDFEQPDDEYAHLLCWEKADNDWKALIERTAWIKPYKNYIVCVRENE